MRNTSASGAHDEQYQQRVGAWCHRPAQHEEGCCCDAQRARASSIRLANGSLRKSWCKLLCGVHLRTVLARQCSSMQQRVQRRPVVNRHGTLVAPFLELVPSWCDSYVLAQLEWRNDRQAVSAQLRRDNVRHKLIKAHVASYDVFVHVDVHVGVATTVTFAMRGF